MVEHTDIRHHDSMVLLAKGLENVAKVASRQQIHNSGGVFVNDGQVDENGRELGTGTIINGAGGQFAPHVNDTTAPGVPTGISVSSAASMLIVAWDGTLTGGVPSDFSHLNVYVDDINVGAITSKGTSVFGPYQVGSEHIVRVSALDDAHNDKGESTPNESGKTSPVTVKIVGSDVDPSKLGISITKSTTDPTSMGSSKGDLWLKYDKDPNGPEPSLIAEWWWDGDKWVAIPVVVYLDQIAARDIHADSAVIGLLSAGIIQSGTFRTSDSGARVEIDANGIREYDSLNRIVADIPSNGGKVSIVGELTTGRPNEASVTVTESTTGINGESISHGEIRFQDKKGRPQGYLSATTGSALNADGETVETSTIGLVPGNLKGTGHTNSYYSFRTTIDELGEINTVIDGKDNYVALMNKYVEIGDGESKINIDGSDENKISMFRTYMSGTNSYIGSNVTVSDNGVSIRGSSSSAYMPVYVNDVRFERQVFTDPSSFLTWQNGCSDSGSWAIKTAGITIIYIRAHIPDGHHYYLYPCILKSGFLPRKTMQIPSVQSGSTNIRFCSLLIGRGDLADGTVEFVTTDLLDNNDYSVLYMFPTQL
jgi:hypothetical protein